MTIALLERFKAWGKSPIVDPVHDREMVINALAECLLDPEWNQNFWFSCYAGHLVKQDGWQPEGELSRCCHKGGELRHIGEVATDILVAAGIPEEEAEGLFTSSNEELPDKLRALINW
jgi:hypothetical protein